MAIRTETIEHVTSDLSGAELSKEDVRRIKVTLVVDGLPQRFEMDLSTTELDELRDVVLKPYVDAAPDGWSFGKVSLMGSSGSSDPERNSKIRAWRMSLPADYTWNGEVVPVVNERGRIPAKVTEAFEAIEEGNGSADNESDEKPAKGKK